jgi:hypothetical protein
MASYPGSVWSPTTKSTNDVIQPAHINDPQNEVVAVETDLLKAWTTEAFNANHYTASAGTWTVDSGDTTLAYHKIGRRMTVTFEVNTSDVSTTPLTLNITIPGGFTAAKTTRNPILVANNGGAFQLGLAEVAANTTTIKCYFSPNLVTNWAADAADTTYVRGQITIETTA